MTEPSIVDWVRGDLLGLDFPAHPDALKASGPKFLTRAFRATGALGEDNEVTAITALQEWVVGGAGTKALLSIAYGRDAPGLARDLFVKFSRNFHDRVRDQGKYIMAPEVRLGALSREPAFPIAVPKCFYADYHHDSSTGIIIMARIPYGEGAVEPHYPKCMDHVLPEPLAHYRALVSNLARLAGAHKAGRLGDAVERNFPLDLEPMMLSRPRFEAELLAKRVKRLTDFIAQYPHLVPPHIADRAFLDSLCAAAPLVAQLQEAIMRALVSKPDMIALCHWNANIDNAWFWHEPDGVLRCGLLDWGGVGQLPLAQSLWGCLSAGEPDMHDAHLSELLDLFVAEYARAGGPTIDRAELEQHLELQAMLSAFHMTTAPPAILREVPDPGLAADRNDPIFTTNETARVQLKIAVSQLNMWQRRDLGRLLQPGAAWRN
jgi:hypothetical protein